MIPVRMIMMMMRGEVAKEQARSKRRRRGHKKRRRRMKGRRMKRVVRGRRRKRVRIQKVNKLIDTSPLSGESSSLSSQSEPPLL